MDTLTKYGTYREDYLLFEELKLSKFDNIPNWTSIRVGECEVNDCNVDIWVEGAPAQFWTINIEFPLGEKKRISTGSGALSDYWKSIEDICSGCLVIDNM